MICNNNYLADILRVCEIKNLIWVMRFQSPLVYYCLYGFVDQMNQGTAKVTHWFMYVCLAMTPGSSTDGQLVARSH